MENKVFLDCEMVRSRIQTLGYKGQAQKMGQEACGRTDEVHRKTVCFSIRPGF